MKAQRITAEEYGRLFAPGTPGTHLYNSTAFTHLMAYRADEVAYVAFTDTKVRAGIVVGLRDGVWCSPFSAPFGGISFVKEQSLECVDSVLSSLREHFGEVEIVLPPDFYYPSMIVKEQVSLLRMGKLVHTDINYHYPLSQAADMHRWFARSAEKNLKAAMKVPFEVTVLDSGDTSQVERAYNVIKANRESHGYPLRMSLEQVLATIPVADTLFIIMTLEGEDVAAAQIQKVTPDIAQVVYWGDAPGYSSMRPMNRLTAEVFRICAAKGFRILDIGPSSSLGEPNYGLCVFKENIGCLPSLKYTFRC